MNALERAAGVIALGVLCLAVGRTVVADTAAAPPEIQWPEVSRTCRPWTYWWWMGSAVTPEEITRHLEAYARAGLGGVHIIPIYGVEGARQQYIEYLSPRWMAMLAHAVREARRLDLGVDMTTGTGWPFGGPWVGEQDAAAKIDFKKYEIAAGQKLSEPLPERQRLMAIMAYADDGQRLDLTEHVDPAGRLDWTAPEGHWTLWAVYQRQTGQQVKRAAPGGEGNVLDPFSREALDGYLARFDAALADYDRSEMVRACYNDSFEAYGANWTDKLFAEFQRRRGYDLREHLPELLGDADTEADADTDAARRVRSDYRQTVAELLLEEFTAPWVAWSHGHGAITRNQAHGSPGNLLDLYAAADIPETEAFGTTWLENVGLEPVEGRPRCYGSDADLLFSKFASSAAHIAGKPLVSCESCTWLGDHFKVPLGHAKAAIDQLFLAGVNHVFYHGMAFSPEPAGWPGWMFYAETHFGMTNTFWRDLPALNAYIARCQAFLQSGRADNDVLVYFPIHDLWATDHGSRDRLQYLTAHNTKTALDENLSEMTAAVRRMWADGWSFDFVSDRLLAEAVTVDGNDLRTRGGRCRVLLVAGCRRMPLETLDRILRLARDGATVAFLGGPPRDVPGLARLDERRKELEEHLAAVGHGGAIGKGRVLIDDALARLLEASGVRRESLVDLGLKYVRRRDDLGHVYFLFNPTKARLDGWVPLAVNAQAATAFDPLTGRCGLAALRSGDGGSEVYVQLGRGQSLVVRAARQAIDGPRWDYLRPKGGVVAVEGTWDVTFVEGGPTLPPPRQTTTLGSWTDWGQPAACFSGTVRYGITFEKPSVDADAWMLELGELCHSAAVTLNGRPLGTVFCEPASVRLDDALCDGTNRLEIDVTNLMANRIIDMDRRQIPWRDFFFVTIDSGTYRDYGGMADRQPLRSGLLGPVRLVPMAAQPTPPGLED